ncbi:MAG: DUF1161 domain-containing protein [Ideonella sp.]|nr:DUF1161 domain-containing protein [Ideonella sp.]
MCKSPLFFVSWLVLPATFAQAPPPAPAPPQPAPATCETLMADIDAKIRASGATNFLLEAVDVEALSSGRVVGSCGQGRKKIVYTPGPGGGGGGGGGSGLTTTGTLGAPIVRAAPPPRPPMPAVLTECKPGYTGPDCSRRLGSAPAAPPPAEPRKPASAP